MHYSLVVKTIKRILPLALLTFCVNNLYAKEHVVDLVISYKKVKFTNKECKAIAVNNQIPAPTLHFKQGDEVTINVHNHLDQDTSIHWHGLILPWQMDGVEGITQNGIQPGKIFTYKFSLEQSGTYWYHAHAGLQEQEGLYGAFLIDPPSTNYTYNKDYAVVLSDWSNTSADQILDNLKKEGDYYSSRFPMQPSLAKFIYDYNNASNESKSQVLDNYKSMQQMRMSIYDYSDVAYDAYLLNGKTKYAPWRKSVKLGDVVRLRFIGAAGSTIYRVKMPDSQMQIIHVSGNDIQPYFINDFSISPGETYDVLVKIESDKPYIIYAESNDTLGVALGALITNETQVIDFKKIKPFNEPQPVTQTMMAMMMNDNLDTTSHSSHASAPTKHKNLNVSDTHKSKHSNSANNTAAIDHSMHQMQNNQATANNNEQPATANIQHANHASDTAKNHMTTNRDISNNMHMLTEPSIHTDNISSPHNAFTSYNTKYQHLAAAVKTNDPNKQIAGEIKMELFGYMERYIWFINGKPEYKTHPIILEPGKRYRFVFINNSMMHHPMHIHGHWFILRNGNGEYDPLLHTIDVAPGATITADVDTDASGQWFFHCHMLYHMFSGMARVIQYSTLLEITENKTKPENIIETTNYVNRPIVRVDEIRPLNKSLVEHPMAHSSRLYTANFLDVGVDPFNNSQKLTFKGLYGYDYNKLELFINDAEMNKGSIENADLDIFYWHLLSQFWTLKAGLNYFYRPADVPFWQPGIAIEGLMPYFIDVDLRIYYRCGSAKFDLEISRDSQITNNFFIKAAIRSIIATKTVVRSQLGSGVNQMRYILQPYYRLKPGLSIFAEYEYQGNYGSFNMMQTAVGESKVQNSITFGLSFTF